MCGNDEHVKSIGSTIPFSDQLISRELQEAMDKVVEGLRGAYYKQLDRLWHEVMHGKDHGPGFKPPAELQGIPGIIASSVEDVSTDQDFAEGNMAFRAVARLTPLDLLNGLHLSLGSR